MNGWIFQRTSELGFGDHALNSSRFPSRFDRALVYRSLLEIPPSELDKICMVVVDIIPHHSTEAIIKPTLEEAVM